MFVGSLTGKTRAIGPGASSRRRSCYNDAVNEAKKENVT